MMTLDFFPGKRGIVWGLISRRFLRISRKKGMPATATLPKNEQTVRTCQEPGPQKETHLPTMDSQGPCWFQGGPRHFDPGAFASKTSKHVLSDSGCSKAGDFQVQDVIFQGGLTDD